MARSKVKVIYSPYHRLHTGIGPEVPERVDAVWHSLEKDREIIEPVKATEEQILKVHAKEFVEKIKEIDRETRIPWGRLRNIKNKYRKVCDDAYIFRGSFDAACYACGAAIEATKCNYDAALALVRPPGHHANRAFTHGFCIFNNPCVGIENSSHRKALIADLDLHFGDGIYQIFKNRRDRRYISFSYIRTDRVEYVNRPFKHVTLRMVSEAMCELDPDLVYIILGFDSIDFGYLTFEQYLKLYKAILEKCPGRKVVFELSGGYDIEKLPIYVNKTLQIADEILRL